MPGMAYPVQIIEKKYYFTARNGIDYTIIFEAVRIPLSDLPFEHLIHECVFIPIVDDDGSVIKGSGDDQDFPETMLQAIDHFLQTYRNAVLIFNADHSGGKQKARFRLFSRWIDRYNNNPTLQKENLTFEDQYFYTVLYLSTNLFAKAIADRIEDILNNKRGAKKSNDQIITHSTTQIPLTSS